MIAEAFKVEAMWKHVKVYCRESSINGLPYLVNDGVHWAEKAFWLLALVTSGLCCGAMISKIAVKVEEDAIVTFTSDIAIPVTEIPFVAVTFCPDLLTYNEFFDYNQTTTALIANEISIDNVTLDELKYMQAIALVLNDDFLLQFNLSIETDDVLNYIRNMTVDWYRLKSRTGDANFDDQYSVEFAEIIGPYGFCNTFNIVEPEKLLNLEIMPEVFNFSRSNEISTAVRKYNLAPGNYRKLGGVYPASVSTYRAGLLLIQGLRDSYMKSFDIDVNHHSSQVDYGWLYLFHSPYDFHSKSSVKYRSQIDFSQQYFIDPKYRIIDKSLEDADPSKVGCYNEGKKQLKFFKIMSKANCQAECLANRTLGTCGCVQFFMVREETTKICGVADMNCFQQVEELENEKNSCDCLARCDEIEYTIEQRQIEFVRFKSRNAFEYCTLILSSEILVFFKAAEFYPLIFRQNFEFIDLVSYTGGALGLFLGFSVLSSVEIIYYFTVRIVFERLRRRKVAAQSSDSNQAGNRRSRTFNYLANFFNESSIHGLNQIARERRSFIERILWATLVVTALVYSCIAARDIYQKYITAAILFSYDDNPQLQEQVSFPAITFSNEVVFNQSYSIKFYLWKMFRYGRKFIFDSLKKEKIYEDSMIKGMLKREDFLTILSSDSEVATNIENIVEKIKNMSEIEWFQKQTATWNYRFQPEFMQIPTKQGFGFAFNMITASKLFTNKISNDFLHPKMMTLSSQKSNPVNLSSDQYPLMSSNKGENGLQIILTRNSRIRSNDVGKYLTFTIHSPYELASSYDDIEVCEFYYGYDLDVLIIPEVITTDPALVSYRPKDRKCYFPGEKTLKFFKIYTRKNCEFECLANFLLSKEQIGCRPFYAARKDSDMVCDLKKLRDLNYFTYRFDRNCEENSPADCECLDECDSVKYKFEISSKVRSDFNYSDNWRNHKSDIEINFRMKDVNIVPLRRYQPFTFNVFVAQSGGLLGLFAAISALSIIEIFYFFFLRIVTNFCIRFCSRK